MAAINMDLLDLTAQLRAIGRGVVFYDPAGPWQNASTDLALTHLGDTEGEITLERNEEYSDLMLPELTGPAKHERYYSGEDPVLSIPIYLADPTLRPTLSPSGSASAGLQRRQRVTEYTVVIFPEELFFDDIAGGDNVYEQLSYISAAGFPGAWTLGGTALDAAHLTRLDNSFWFWRGHFTRPPLTFRHADGGKALDTVLFQAMHSGVMPIGHHLYTSGDPEDALIDIEPSA